MLQLFIVALTTLCCY